MNNMDINKHFPDFLFCEEIANPDRYSGPIREYDFSDELIVPHHSSVLVIAHKYDKDKACSFASFLEKEYGVASFILCDYPNESYFETRINSCDRIIYLASKSCAASLDVGFALGIAAERKKGKVAILDACCGAFPSGSQFLRGFPRIIHGSDTQLEVSLSCTGYDIVSLKDWLWA